MQVRKELIFLALLPRPLYPAKKLYVVVAPTTPIGITNKGYNKPRLIPITTEFPALITIKGTAENKTKINLDRMDIPPFSIQINHQLNQLQLPKISELIIANI